MPTVLPGPRRRGWPVKSWSQGQALGRLGARGPGGWRSPLSGAGALGEQEEGARPRRVGGTEAQGGMYSLVPTPPRDASGYISIYSTSSKLPEHRQPPPSDLFVPLPSRFISFHPSATRITARFFGC